MSTLTLEEVTAAVPAQLRTSVSQHLVDMLNNLQVDPEMASNIKDNFLSYSAVLKEGRFKIEDYFNAVQYVSYKIMNMSNQDAYIRTFPQRHADLVARGASAKDISSYVAAYHKGKLVNLIMEQVMVPVWVLNQDMFQKALNVQYDLMTDVDMSGKVRTDAANSILTHLKKPEKMDFQLNMNTPESSGMKELTAALTNLANAQLEQIREGNVKTIDIASSKLPVQDQ